MIEVTAGFFKVKTDEAVADIEGRCAAYTAAPPAAGTVTVGADGQQYVLQTPTWDTEHRVLVATMWRVRERALPSAWSHHGTTTPVDTRLSEAASFAYRPSHELMLIQHNASGPRHSRAGRLLEEAKIVTACHIAADIVPDVLQRMKDAAILRRIEFSLTGIDAAKEGELRQAGLGGALDEMRKFGGTSIHLTISLGHTPGALDPQARGLLERLAEITSGVRTVKAGVKDTEEHDVELLDLMKCRSKIEFEVEEVGMEIDRSRCRDRLLFNIVNR